MASKGARVHRAVFPNTRTPARQPRRYDGQVISARQSSNPTSREDRPLLIAACVLLVLVFITGGDSQSTNLGVMAAQLLALPVLLYALWRGLATQRLGRVRAGIAVLVFIACIPLLQLLPLPAWLSNLSPWRVALAHDLAAAGVAHAPLRWSLDPAATERDALLLLPPIALFFAAIALGHEARRWLLWAVVGLAAFTLLLAFAQLGVPQDSFLNPFPDFAPALSGVFANKNHQSIMLAIGLILALVLGLEAWRRVRTRRAKWTPVVLCALLGFVFASVLPLVNSRAGVIIALVLIGVALLASGTVVTRRLRESHVVQAATVLTVLALAIGLFAANHWMQHDALVEGSRWMMTRVTTKLAIANLPWGSGIGSFVPVFAQGAPAATLEPYFYNAAHDEYAQWFLTAGVLAVPAVLGALTLLVDAARRALRMPVPSRARTTALAALLGVLALLLHSAVDYPMRTPALMSIAALLAGIALAAAHEPIRTPATRPQPDMSWVGS